MESNTDCGFGNIRPVISVGILLYGVIVINASVSDRKRGTCLVHRCLKRGRERDEN